MGGHLEPLDETPEIIEPERPATRRRQPDRRSPSRSPPAGTQSPTLASPQPPGPAGSPTLSRDAHPRSTPGDYASDSSGMFPESILPSASPGEGRGGLRASRSLSTEGGARGGEAKEPRRRLTFVESAWSERSVRAMSRAERRLQESESGSWMDAGSSIAGSRRRRKKRGGEGGEPEGSLVGAASLSVRSVETDALAAESSVNGGEGSVTRGERSGVDGGAGGTPQEEESVDSWASFGWTLVKTLVMGPTGGKMRAQAREGERSGAVEGRLEGRGPERGRGPSTRSSGVSLDPGYLVGRMQSLAMVSRDLLGSWNTPGGICPTECERGGRHALHRATLAWTEDVLQSIVAPGDIAPRKRHPRWLPVVVQGSQHGAGYHSEVSVVGMPEDSDGEGEREICKAE